MSHNVAVWGGHWGHWRGLGLLIFGGLCACAPETFDGTFVAREEIALQFPGANRHATSAQDPRPLTIAIIDDLNAVNGDALEILEAVVTGLEGRVPTRRDGGFGVYGPFEADDVGLDLDLAFLVRADDRYLRREIEVWVAPAATTDESAFAQLADLSRFEFEGEREISLELALGTFDAYPALAPALSQRYALGGTLHTTVEGLDLPRISVAVDEAEILRRAPVDRAFAGRGTVRWEAHGDGGASLALRAAGPFDDHGFSGAEENEMEIAARYAESGAGRIEGRVESGDLVHGAFTIVACWDPFLQPNYSFVDPPYQPLDPTLVEGTAENCAFASAAPP